MITDTICQRLVASGSICLVAPVSTWYHLTVLSAPE